MHVMMTETFAIAVALLLVGIGLGWMTAVLRHRSVSGALAIRLAESNARLDARNFEMARLERRVEELGAADVKCAALAAQLDAERTRSEDQHAITELVTPVKELLTRIDALMLDAQSPVDGNRSE